MMFMMMMIMQFHIPKQFICCQCDWYWPFTETLVDAKLMLSLDSQEITMDIVVFLFQVVYSATY